MKATLQFAAMTADVSGSNVQTFSFPDIIGGITGYRIRVSNQTTNGGLSGLPVANSRMGIGYCDGTTSFAWSAFSHNGETSKPVCGVRYDDASVIQMCGEGTTALEAEAINVAILNKSVQIAWTDYPGFALLMEVTVYYGGAKCNLHSFTPSSSINGTVTKTGLAFAPNCLEVISQLNAFAADSTAISARIFWGAAVLRADGSTIQHVSFGMFERSNPTATGTSYQASVVRDDCVAQQITTNAAGTTSTSARVQCTAFTSDGYTMKTLDVAASVPIAVFAVFYPSGDRWCGIPTLVNSTTGVKNITAPGFRPWHLDSIGTQLTAKNTVTTNTEATSFSLGSGVVAGQWNASWTGLDGLWFPTPGATIQHSSADAKAIQVYDQSTLGAVLYSSLIDAFKATGWDVNVDVENLTTDRMTGWLAIGAFEIPDPLKVTLVLPTVTRNITATPSPLTVPLVLPAPARKRTMLPSALAVPLVLPAPSVIYVRKPAALAVPLVLPAPILKRTLLASPITIPLVLPTVTRNLTAKPSALAVPLVLPAVTRAITVAPSALTVPLVLPAPVNVRRLLASPLAVPLVLPVVTRAIAITPAALTVPLVLPAPTHKRTLLASPVAVPLVLPVVTRNLTASVSALQVPLILPMVAVVTLGQTIQTPTALHLPLVLPAPSITRTEKPAALLLPLVLPAPVVTFLRTPAALAVPLVLPAPSVTRTEKPASLAVPLVLPPVLVGISPRPSALVVALVLPAPIILRTLAPGPLLVVLVLPQPSLLVLSVGPTIPAEIARAVLLRSEVLRSVLIETEVPRGVDLPAALE